MHFVSRGSIANFRDQLSSILVSAQDQDISIDVSNIDIFDSSCISLLLHIKQKAKSCYLIGCNDEILHLLKTMRLNTYFISSPTEASSKHTIDDKVSFDTMPD